MNSAIVDNYQENTEIAWDIISCNNCGYIKYHDTNNESDFLCNGHFTCICNLFEAAVVCCYEGYSNMLSYIPSVAAHTPLPQCTAADQLDGFEDGVIRLSRRKFDDLTTRCIHDKILALSKYPYIKRKYLPIIFEI